MTVNMYDSFDRALDLVQSADEIFLTTHERADGDGFGSALALAHVFEQMGKRARICVVDGAPLGLEFLTEDRVVETELHLPDGALLFVLDASHVGRTGFVSEIEDGVSRGARVVEIDHHLKSDEYDGSGERVFIFDEEASSTAELVYYFLTYSQVEIDRYTANGLLAGVFSDTGSFQHSNTTARVLGIASDLVGKGARLQRISEKMYTNKSLRGLRVWGIAMSRVKVVEELGAAVTYITLDDMKRARATKDELDGLVNVINGLPGIRFSMLMLEMPGNEIKVSLRSEEGRGVDVAAIASRFGGGGHRLAAGFSVDGRFVYRDGRWRIEGVDGEEVEGLL